MAKWSSERDRDVARKRSAAKSSKTVVVPPCADRHRRETFEACDEDWLRYYCAELFWYEFTPQQLAMIESIRNAILYGGDQALAASRGEGKTVLFERMLLKYTLQGLIKFSVLFGASHQHAIDSLQSMRDEVEKNERLCEDYPEVCVPVQALEDTPNRAHYQLVTGKRHDNGEVYEGESSRFTWCGNEIIFPNVPGSPAAWGVIATRGLDGAVRGLRKKSQRPQVVGIDDPDTDETISNPVQAAKLEKRIDRGIAGLGGQQRGVARIMLTTLQTPDCVSAWYTDPKRKPSFKGKRFRFLITRPERMDLWEDYMRMREEDQQRKDETGNHVDEHARRAHQFYLDNRAAMDFGAEVANPNRFNPQVLPDGSQIEVSSLQRYFNEVARIGQDAVSTEYDNDPPEEDKEGAGGITSQIVGSRINGLAYKEIHVTTKVLVSFLDLGNTICNYVDSAWSEDCIGRIPDYGMIQVNREGEALEKAMMRLLHQWRQSLLGKYTDQSGNTLPIDLALIDSGSGEHSETVYKFCRDVGPPFFPSKGMKDHWRPNVKSLKYGDHWALTAQPRGVRLYEFHSTYWKMFAHQRFITPTLNENNQPNPGSLSLYVCPELKQFKDDRREFTHQVVGEIWGIKKPGGKPEWIGSKPNHYLDCSAGCCYGANVKGIRLVGEVKKTRTPPAQRPTAASIAAMSRRA